MINGPNHNQSRPREGALILGMTAQAKIRVRLGQHLPVDGAVRIVAGSAAFAHCLVFKSDRTRLLAMTLRTTFVEPCHGQAARGLEGIHPVRVMALDTVHAFLDHRMVIRELKLGVSRQVAVKARGRITARIVDELPPAPCGDVQTPRPMTRFATGIAAARGIAEVNPCMRAGHEGPDVVGVAVQTGPVARIMSARNLRRHMHNARCGGTGVQEQCQQRSEASGQQAGKSCREQLAQIKLLSLQVRPGLDVYGGSWETTAGSSAPPTRDGSAGGAAAVGHHGTDTPRREGGRATA